MPTEQKQIDDFLNIGDRILMLRQSHRPTTNHRFAASDDLCDFANVML